MGCHIPKSRLLFTNFKACVHFPLLRSFEGFSAILEPYLTFHNIFNFTVRNCWPARFEVFHSCVHEHSVHLGLDVSVGGQMLASCETVTSTS
jgi:hypothetical protein